VKPRKNSVDDAPREIAVLLVDAPLVARPLEPAHDRRFPDFLDCAMLSHRLGWPVVAAWMSADTSSTGARPGVEGAEEERDAREALADLRGMMCVCPAPDDESFRTWARAKIAKLRTLLDDTDSALTATSTDHDPDDIEKFWWRARDLAAAVTMFADQAGEYAILDAEDRAEEFQKGATR